MMIKNFVHYPGVHCESTATRNLLTINGLHLSELMVFGFDSGLDFIYWDMKKNTYLIMTSLMSQSDTTWF